MQHNSYVNNFEVDIYDLCVFDYKIGIPVMMYSFVKKYEFRFISSEMIFIATAIKWY